MNISQTSQTSPTGQTGSTDPTKRFTDRVGNYLLFRPRYPRAVVDLLKEECGLSSESVIADLGSGTGFLAEPFLANGNTVVGIEPNREMREAGERLLKGYSIFKSVDAKAEATGLPDRSIDFITAGQAFHWFDRESCRVEFARILRGSGWIVLVWNDRRTDSTPFLREYEDLLHKYATDYAQVDHKRIDAGVLRQFFGADPQRREFPNHQHCDLAFLRGRLLSSSYVPAAGQPGHAEMLTALERLFNKYEKNGQVTLEQDMVVFFGKLVEETLDHATSSPPS